MRPAYAAILFFGIGVALFVFARYRSGRAGGPTGIARRTRQRTAAIFMLVATGLLLLDFLTRNDFP
jgi:hypothetical protein